MTRVADRVRARPLGQVVGAADRDDRHASLHFIRTGELDDTFALAEILVEDEHEFLRER